MQEVDKTKEQLATEVAHLRQRIAELEQSDIERKQAEEELLEAAEQYRILTGTSMDGFALVDVAGHLLDVNEAYCRMIGYSRDELLKMSVSDIEAKATLDEIETQHKKTMAGSQLLESQHRCKDGRIIDVEVNMTYMRQSDKIFVFLRDITERKRAEAALKESEENFRALAENAADGIVILSSEGTHVYVNRRAAEISGYTVDELLQVGFQNLFPENERNRLMEMFRKRFAGESGTAKFETVIIRKDGQRVPLEVSSALTTWHGQPADIVFSRDITERKLIEDELKLKDNAIASALTAIAIGEFGGNLTYVNPAFVRMWGYDNENEVLGRSAVEFWQEKEKAQEIIEALFKGKNVTGELVAKRKDGSLFDVQLAASMVTDEAGKPVSMMASFVDVTEHKQAEEALKKSEEKYRTVVELSPDGVAIASKGRHVFANKSLAKIFGVSSPDELLGKSIMDYIHPSYRKTVLKRIAEQTKHGVLAPLIEEKMLRADGTVIHTEVAAAPLEYEGEQAVLAIIRDISERKEIEEALRESEERFRTIFEGAPDAILLADPESGRIIDANPAALHLLLRPREEIVGLHHSKLHPPQLQEYEKKKFFDYVQHVRTKRQTHPIESAIVRSDGSTVPVEILAQMIDINGRSVFQGTFRDITGRRQMEVALQKANETLQAILEFAPLPIFTLDIEGRVGSIWNTAAEEILGWKKEEVLGKPYPAVPPGKEEEFINNVRLGFKGIRGREARRQRRDGSPIDYSIYTAPLRDSQGDVTFLVAILLDITEQKQAEKALRESEEKYRSLVESSEDSIYLVARDCTYLFINKKHLSRLGMKSSQVIGRAYGEFHSPEETQDFTQKVEMVFKTGKSLSYEYRSERDDRYFIRTLSPVKSLEKGNPTAATVISKDITDLKRAEETLREREAFNFALFHYNPIETIVVDRRGRVIGFNLAKEKSGDRLPTIGDFMYKDYAGKHEIDIRAELMNCIASGNVKAFPECRYGDRYLAITISPFSQGALIISEDITERKRAEEFLQKERDTFFSVLRKAPYGVILIDKDGNGILSNIEFTNVTGYTLTDVPTLKDWFRLAYPDKKYRDMVIHTLRRDAVEADGDELYQNKFQRTFFRTFTVTCKDGTAKEIEFRPTMLEDASTIIMIADITERKRMHELLETAAAEWRTTFDAINDAVCLLDQHGRIKRCNNAMLGMLGKPFSEVVDRFCWEVLYGVSRPPKQYPIVRMQKTRHRETDIVLKDNRWFNISVDPLLDDDGNLVGGVHIMSDITDRMQAEEELQNSREQLRNLSTYLESIREQERTVIAREIHDELAQALTALKMDLSWLDNRLPRDQQPLIDKTKSMHFLIDTTIKSVKRISAELRPGILDDLGLVAAIEWQADEFQNRTGIPCHVISNPMDMSIDHDRSTAIFRIFQETLTNIARHARATRVRVSLKEKGGKLTLRVKDNGRGITEKQIADSNSFGLIGMRERVHPWGGTVSIKGVPGKGTTVNVSVPITNVKR